MSRAWIEVLQSIFYASLRGRILLGILCAYFALALPVILPFGSVLQSRTNHRIDSALIAQEMNYTVWFDLREQLASVEPALLATVLVAFLFGIFSSGGWLEVLYKREGKPGLKVFCSGGGARFFRFLRLAALSLIAIAFARWIIYGAPGQSVLKWCIGTTDLDEFHNETRRNLFLNLQSALFTGSIAAIVLVSDLARAALVVRGGRSAVLGAIHGLSLFARRPLQAIAAAGLPFLLELGILISLAWGIDYASAGEPTIINLTILFLLILLVCLVREIMRAGRLGGLLAIADLDSEARMERRYGAFADPVVAAAGRAMTTEDEG